MSISSVKTGAVGVSLLAGNDAFDPAATWLIARANGTGSSGTITFSAIPATFQHLQIRMMTHTTSGTRVSVNLQVNGDTGSNYARHRLYGDGTSALAAGGASTTSFSDAGSTFGDGLNSDKYGVSIIDIHDYASTTKNKTFRCFSGRNDNAATTDSWIVLSSGLWMNTSAINEITLTSGSGNFNTSSTFALYGIKGA